MCRSDAIVDDFGPPAPAWKGWPGLAWVLVFATLYAGMVIRERAPWIWERLAQ